MFILARLSTWLDGTKGTEGVNFFFFFLKKSDTMTGRERHRIRLGITYLTEVENSFAKSVEKKF